MTSSLKAESLFSLQPQMASALQFFDWQQGQLRIAQHDAAALAEIAGGEPLYVYSRQALQSRMQSLRNLVPKNIKIHYAVKANPYPALVQLMATLADGFDVASRRELQIALETGIDAALIGFAGPGKSQSDLAAAIAAGCMIHVESRYEIEQIQKLAAGKKVRIALRVNPSFALKAAGMKMSGNAQPFGIDQGEIEQMLQDFPIGNIELAGFHFYCGSQSLQSEAILEMQAQIFTLARSWLPFCQGKPYLNIGGGFGIAYFAKDQPLNEQQLSAGMAKLAQEFSDIIDNADVVLELGRFLVAQAGVYLSRVRDIKKSYGTTFLVCSGGLHQHLANSGNFGQVIRRNYPVLLADKILEQSSEHYQVVGPLCTPLDILADKIMLPYAHIGDWFAVLLSGAYGATASPQGFLGHDGVRELLV